MGTTSIIFVSAAFPLRPIRQPERCKVKFMNLPERGRKLMEQNSTWRFIKSSLDVAQGLKYGATSEDRTQS